MARVSPLTAEMGLRKRTRLAENDLGHLFAEAVRRVVGQRRVGLLVSELELSMDQE